MERRTSSRRNRFGVAKELVGEFVARRQDDRIGIVTFGSARRRAFR